MKRRTFVTSVSSFTLAAPALIALSTTARANLDGGVAETLRQGLQGHLRWQGQDENIRQVYFVDPTGGYRKNVGQIGLVAEDDMDDSSMSGRSKKVGYVLPNGRQLFLTSRVSPAGNRANIYLPGNSPAGMVYGEVQVSTRRARSGVPSAQQLERQLRKGGEVRYFEQDDTYVIQAKLTYKF